MKYSKRLLGLAGVLAATGAMALSALPAASAAPVHARPAASGIEHFQLMSTNGDTNGAPIVATGLFMAATAIALIASWLLMRTLPIMPMVSGVVVFIFGALTLYLQDDIFIKMKPTIVNTLFGGVLLGGLYFGRSLLGYVFDSAFRLDAEGWRKLTFRWGLFFLFLALANEVVWRNFSTDFWVTFKVWGIMPITLLFTFSQMPLILRHSIEDKTEKVEEAGK